ncbi:MULTISPECIES: hypothetical protein [Sorangium]|uniref:Uncharacterized protein n=1 Tax=Sorangium cellulosum (strain So ce56) TaxID=448385 RepID=A9FV82_SORC5|nr:hypothetical protein [Sorangium cellulosum]CAN92247.1 hypothetical protein sce2088 [Sorangium cellulosum So ce56]
MSDFLGRLAGRTVGVADVVKPLVASRYAPDPRRPAAPSPFSIAEERAVETPPASPWSEVEGEQVAGDAPLVERTAPARHGEVMRPAAVQAGEGAIEPSALLSEVGERPRQSAEKWTSRPASPATTSAVRARMAPTAPPLSSMASSAPAQPGAAPAAAPPLSSMASSVPRQLGPAPSMGAGPPASSPVPSRGLPAHHSGPAMPAAVSATRAATAARPTAARPTAPHGDASTPTRGRTEAVIGPQAALSPFAPEAEALLVPDAQLVQHAPPLGRATPRAGGATSIERAEPGAQTADPSAPTTAPAPAQAAPTIRVSIGRIEVRAAPPPPSPAPSPERPRPPLLGLQDYLAQQGARR